MMEIIRPLSESMTHMVSLVEQTTLEIIHFVIGCVHALGDLFLIVIVIMLACLFVKFFVQFIGLLLVVSFFLLFMAVAWAIISH